MPLVLHAIRSVEIGSITMRKSNAPCQLDSYQDDELQSLRCEWLNLIEKRKVYLESEVNLLNQQTSNIDRMMSLKRTDKKIVAYCHLDKTPNDHERETALLEQLLRLAEERDLAELPPPGSGIPGNNI
jgi:hypothetical protein